MPSTKLPKSSLHPTVSKAVEERDKTVVEVTYDIDYDTCLGSSDNAMIYAANRITVTTSVT